MILHGNWLPEKDGDGNFIFWGEKGKSVYKVSKRKKANSLHSYPELCKVEDLLAFFEGTGQEFGEITFRTSEDGSDIIKYEVRGLRYLPYTTIENLILLEEKLKDNYEIKLSDELNYWITVAKFSLELIIKHRYYPAIIKKCGNTRGMFTFWEYYTVNESDIARLSLLEDNMPPCTRIYFRSDEENNKPAPKRELLDSFINWIINGVVRKHSFMDKNDTAGFGIENRDQWNAWFDSLQTPSGKFAICDAKKSSFLDEYERWVEPISRREEVRTFRTCLSIKPPKDQSGNEHISGETWNIEFFLQATDDTGILLPASYVWENSNDLLVYLDRKLQNPQEKLIQDLGRAARIFKPMERSLYEAAPTNCDISFEEACDFLEEGSMLLEESGFGIMAPVWWYKPKDISVKIKSRGPSNSGINGKGKIGFDTLVEYDWKVSIGDMELSAEEFEMISALKVPLVRIRGTWVQIGHEQLKVIRGIWEKRNKLNKVKLGELIKGSLGKEEVIEGIPNSILDEEDPINELVAKLSQNNRLKLLPQPTNFIGKLRDYQIRGYSWLCFLRNNEIGACLADDMGLGKTIQLISLVLHEKESRKRAKKMLLVCPTSVVGNWKKEFEKFAPGIKVLIHHGSNRKRKEEFKKGLRGYDVVLTTYNLANRDEEEISGVSWGGLILDEAQNIKNTSSKQTKVLKKVDSEFKIALTGTPVENRLGDLWSLMDFLNPGYLGSWNEFKETYVVPVEREKDRKKSEELKNIVAPFVLRRLKTDKCIIKDLPDKLERKVYINLTEEQATLYEAIVKDMLGKIKALEGIERKGLVLSAISKLKQVCNHPVQFLKEGEAGIHRSGKMRRLVEMLQEAVLQGDKVLIFTQFAEMGTILTKEIEKALKVRTLFLHGGVPRKKREEMIEEFQKSERDPMVFVLSLKAGGVGLNLTRANHVFHFDRWWNPAVENQATDRAFRIGQKKNVMVHKFVCTGTLEDRIDEMLEEKTALAESIVGAGENWITEMTDKQLHELFSLRRSELMFDND